MVDVGPRGAPSQPRLVELSRYRVRLSWPSTLVEDEIVAPRPEDVHRFVRSLDGGQFDQVLLITERQGVEVLVAIEGDAGGAMTMTVRGPQIMSRLVDPSRRGDEECEVQSGGVTLEHPCNQVVHIDLIEIALAQFLEDGELSRSVQWVQEPSFILEPGDDG